MRYGFLSWKKAISVGWIVVPCLRDCLEKHLTSIGAEKDAMPSAGHGFS